MSTSFVYTPRVHLSDRVVTPDILIDRLFVSRKGDTTLYPVPVSRLTADVGFQAAGAGCAPDAGLALVGAGAGMLVAAASDHRPADDPPGAASHDKPLGREAWRYAEIAGHLDEFMIRASGGGGAPWQEAAAGEGLDVAGALSVFGGEVAPGDAVIVTGLPFIGASVGGPYVVEVEDPVLDRRLTLHYAIDNLFPPTAAS